MKRDSIRSHLQPYSILTKRKTTVNHAFASAIAPADAYDDGRLAAALIQLGQDPDEHLRCVYCGALAETWDHAFALVSNSQFSGHGHTFSNLLPSCRNCNSRKGSKDWRSFLQSSSEAPEDIAARISACERYFQCFDKRYFPEEQIEALCPNEICRLRELREQVHQLFREADQIAGDIRRKLAAAESLGS